MSKVLDDLLSAGEIAERMGVKHRTIYKWRERATLAFPEPETYVAGRPVWRWATVEQWARETGRLS